jgi:hypothetical protein
MRGGWIMLRTTCPNISVITNFGCRANCWYCIWKGHKLQNINDPTDWVKLRKFLHDNKSKGKVSVSGGGDCLYRFDEYYEWWVNFFKITRELNMLVDIHSREKFLNSLFWKGSVNRSVFSSDRLEDDVDYLRYLRKFTQVRITHLVTFDTTFNMIDDYLKFQKEIDCQFTIKELIGYDDGGMYKKIREKYPDIYHLDEGDYNIYYMPNNTVTDSFL